MDYMKYVKGDYTKMALKGIKLPFREKWESAAVGAQCLFSINSTMNHNAMKLIGAIPDSFMDKFENGQPLELNNETRKHVELLLRVQNYMKAIVSASAILPPLIDIILKNKQAIDPGIYKYFVGNRSVLENYSSEAQKQVSAIDASFTASFKDNANSIEQVRQDLSETLARTKSDLNGIIAKFAEALNLNDILKASL